MNRGSARGMGRADPLTTASMRPRFMNRGSWTLAFVQLIHVSGFNEAPIHESGKWLATRARNRRPVPRFNEAPIHESGK